MNKLTDRAYAKINLFLEVVGKRPDGYHELETIFHQIDLYDNISIAISKTKKNESNISLSCPKLDIFPEQNIAYKAAKLFCEKFNVKDHINITIEKNIPVGAGLGGGSSDAAAVLRLLADHYLQDQDFSVIEQIALSLGADVPFFLKGGTCVGRGIGEKLESVQLSRQYYFVLVLPDIFVSTANVYQSIARILTDGANYDIVLSALQKGNIEEISPLLYNRLEEISFSLYPKLKEIKEVLASLTKYGCLMSGSGSAFFVIVPDQRECRELASLISNYGYNTVGVMSYK